MRVLNLVVGSGVFDCIGRGEKRLYKSFKENLKKNLFDDKGLRQKYDFVKVRRHGKKEFHLLEYKGVLICSRSHKKVFDYFERVEVNVKKGDFIIRLGFFKIDF